jgi:hypothetical protein
LTKVKKNYTILHVWKFWIKDQKGAKMAELNDTDKFDDEIIELLRLTDTDNAMQQIFEIGLNAGIEMEADNSDFPWDKFRERCKQKVDMNILLYQMIPVYSRYYTREEITGLIAFYETPLGKKLIKELHQVTQEIIAANQEWAQDLIEKIGNDSD